ncbi:putative ABC transport system permease protein [Dyadobacter sp. SG02]|uniref:ABC transporter permease n=1 Tax=Dyadobacter sp. SG02 TaxID=1855291 RepID=UPI0008B189CC|nr:ABC transporter permease [Dyadobacter sp. SG02]SEI53661.1 putative ABC transport system permease protein [Dyadobacter sp. SG02]
MNKTDHSPPSSADKLLQRLLAPHLLETILGDLHEDFAYNVKRLGEKRARLLYWRQALGFVKPRYIRRNRSQYPSTPLIVPGMLINYFKIAFRNLLRHKLYGFINVGGLGLSLFCALLIGFWVRDELSYDRFHRDPERIYRIVKDFVTIDGSRTPDATTPSALGAALQKDIPEIESVTRIFPGWNQKFLIRQPDAQFYEEGVYRVDDSFFDVFTFPFVAGNKQSAFPSPKSVVLTETMARKYFGPENPVGKRLNLRIDGGDFIVTGVLKDVPGNSHFHFDFLIPLRRADTSPDMNPDTDWASYTFYTYAKLKPNTSTDAFTAKLRSLVRKYQPENRNIFYVQALTDIHLNSKLKWELGQNSDNSYVRILSFIGLFILVIAGINYVNLATARSSQRAREVGVRKAAGAFRRSLMVQFLGESMVVSILAAVLAIGALALSLPYFSDVLEKELTVWNRPGLQNCLVALAIAAVTGLLAGLYPALFLSSFQPAQVLKSQKIPGARLSWLRQGLVTFQFWASVLLMIGSIVVTRQINFLKTAPLGFDKEQIITLPNIGGLKNLDALRGELLGLKDVVKVGASSGVFGESNQANGMAKKGADQAVVINFMVVDNDFLQTLDVRVKQGRLFSAGFPSDSTASLLINETAARQLDLHQPLGTVVDTDLMGDYRTVVGVVKDFHFTSLHNSIKPFAFVVGSQNLSNLFIKVRGNDMKASLAEIERKWKELVPQRPFTYFFLDENFAALHRSDELFQRVVSGLTIMALCISGLGLFALASFTTERRTKEIGVRKVMGASVGGIVLLLLGDFLKLVLIAVVIACPVAWYIMNYWLQNFAYKIDMEWWFFALAGALSVMIAFSTVCLQSIKAALMNPVKSLRSE